MAFFNFSDIEHTISHWPNVNRRETKTQVVYSVSSINFCWLSPATSMVQIFPPLGPKCNTRRLERNGNKVKIIHQPSGPTDATYDDPGHNLLPRFSYPGFMCSKISEEDALHLIHQSYENAKVV